MKNSLPSVLITRNIPDIGLTVLKNCCKIDHYDRSTPIPRTELKKRIQKAQALYCLVTDSIDREIMDSAPELKIISNMAVGVDNIDVQYATQKGILVTNTPGVLTDATADLTWALLLAVARQVLPGDRMVRTGQFIAWDPLLLLGADISGKTMGIIGAGRIGQAVARRSLGWKMQILYFNRHPRPSLETELRARKVPLTQLLRESDFVSLHLPLSPDTHHLIGGEELKLMKPTAYLINTSRGALIDEKALVNALQKGEIAGAGLDVFEGEPKLTPGLEKLENVVLTPHIGSATFQTRNEMARIAALNIVHYFKGIRPLSVVNEDLWEIQKTAGGRGNLE